MIVWSVRNPVDLSVRLSGIVEVALRACNEKCQVLIEGVQTSEVDVGAVHDVEGPRLQDQFVEDIDIVRFSLCNVDKTGDIAV